MRILFTNRQLVNRAGTELATRDLALSLLARGHKPICYAPVLGDLARQMRDESIPVTDDLSSLGAAPDIIHGQHHLPAFQALTYFPEVPGIFVCHGWLPWAEAPHAHPRWRRFVAVDETCRDRIEVEGRVPPALVRLHLNWVDTERFVLPEGRKVRSKPKRALVFSNYALKGTQSLKTIRESCEKFGITLDVVGLGTKNSVSRPEEILPNYDLVFAVGRSALEGMACGCAVILCTTISRELSGSGPLVSTANFERLRNVNFGYRAIDYLNQKSLEREIAAYDPVEVESVTRRVREEASFAPASFAYEALYHEVIEEYTGLQRGPEWYNAESQAISAYLRWINERVIEGPYPLHQVVNQVDANISLKQALRSWVKRRLRGRA